MREYTINYAMMNPLVDFEIYFNETYYTIYDLSTSLMNLQALISGISRVYEDNQKYYFFNDVPMELEIKEEKKYIKRANELRNILDLEFENLDWRLKKEISEKISNREFEQKKMAASRKEQENVRPYSTTSAKFASQYKDIVKLNKFEQGSLLLNITSSVLAGIILKFIERLVFREDNNLIKISVSKNTLILMEEGIPKKIINLDNKSGSDFVEIQKDGIPLDDYYKKIINSIEINPWNLEESVSNLFTILEKEKIFIAHETYDRKGIKTVVNDTKRIIDFRL